MYRDNDFDLAGFAVGVAEKDELDRVSKVEKNQLVVALPRLWKYTQMDTL